MLESTLRHLLATGLWSQPPRGSPEAAGIRLSLLFGEGGSCLWLPLGEAGEQRDPSDLASPQGSI